MVNTLIVIEGVLISVLTSYVYISFKYDNKKINIMNVRNELQKIRRIENNEKNRKF